MDNAYFFPLSAILAEISEDEGLVGSPVGAADAHHRAYGGRYGRGMHLAGLYRCRDSRTHQEAGGGGIPFPDLPCQHRQPDVVLDGPSGSELKPEVAGGLGIESPSDPPEFGRRLPYDVGEGLDVGHAAHHDEEIARVAPYFRHFETMLLQGGVVEIDHVAETSVHILVVAVLRAQI